MLFSREQQPQDPSSAHNGRFQDHSLLSALGPDDVRPKLIGKNRFLIIALLISFRTVNLLYTQVGGYVEGLFGEKYQLSSNFH